MAFGEGGGVCANLCGHLRRFLLKFLSGLFVLKTYNYDKKIFIFLEVCKTRVEMRKKDGTRDQDLLSLACCIISVCYHLDTFTALLAHVWLRKIFVCA